jgi:hypothetical protein
MEIPVIPDHTELEQTYFDGPTGTFPERTVCLKRLSSLTDWNISTGDLFHLHLFYFFSPVPGSSRILLTMH